MAESSDTKAYLMPKTKNPRKKVMRQDGMFVNQPSYAERGGFTGPSKLRRGELATSMHLERSGPSSQKGKPI